MLYSCISFHVHNSELFSRDTHWTLWSTTAWGYLWYSVITDFTHTVSEVPCVVEQRALVLFYEGRSAVTTVANFWELSLKVNISYSWLDWFTFDEDEVRPTALSPPLHFVTAFAQPELSSTSSGFVLKSCMDYKWLITCDNWFGRKSSLGCPGYVTADRQFTLDQSVLHRKLLSFVRCGCWPHHK